MKSTDHVDELTYGKILEVDLHGKLNREDFERIGPETDRLIRQHGKIRILVTMRDFEGWDAGALWEELKWDAKHFNDVERLAMVGDESWQKWMVSVCKPFTTATVRYFSFDQLDEANEWLNESS
jgi:SpoIIAA-like